MVLLLVALVIVYRRAADGVKQMAPALIDIGGGRRRTRGDIQGAIQDWTDDFIWQGGNSAELPLTGPRSDRHRQTH